MLLEVWNKLVDIASNVLFPLLYKNINCSSENIPKMNVFWIEFFIIFIQARTSKLAKEI